MKRISALLVLFSLLPLLAGALVGQTFLEAGLGEPRCDRIARATEQLERREFAAARKSLEKILEEDRRTGNRAEQAQTLGLLGLASWMMNDTLGAIGLVGQQVALLRDLGEREALLSALGNFATFKQGLQDWDGSIAIWRERLALQRESNDKKGAAESLYYIASIQQVKGDPALEGSLQEALDLYRQIGDSAGEANVIEARGAVRENAADFPKALELYRESLALWRAHGDRSAVVRVLVRMGETQRGLGKELDAAATLQEALDLATQLGDAKQEGEIRSTLASLYRSLGQTKKADEILPPSPKTTEKVVVNGKEVDLDEAIASVMADPQIDLITYEAMLQVAREMHWPIGETRALNGLGTTYLQMGQYSKAQGFLEEALGLERKLNNLSGEATVLLNLGLLYTNQGRFPQAVEVYEQGLALARRLQDLSTEAEALNGMGSVLVQQGRYSQALEKLLAGLDVARRAQNRVRQATLLTNFGATYSAMGQTRKALEHHESALAIYKDLADLLNQANSLNSLGLLSLELGETSRAMERFDLALDLARKAKDRDMEATILFNLGSVQMRLGRSQEGLDNQAQALRIVREIGHRPHEAVLLMGMAGAHLQIGAYPTAAVTYQQALEIVRALGHQDFEGLILKYLGEIQEKKGDLQQALSHFEAAIVIGEEVRRAESLDEFKIGIAEHSVDAYSHAVGILLRLGRPAEAFNLSERARARSFLDSLGEAQLEDRERADSTLLAEERVLRQEKAALERELLTVRSALKANDDLIASLSNQLADKKTRHAQVLEQIRLQRPEAASLVSVSPLTLQEVQRRLDTKTALVSFYFVPDGTIAFVVTAGSFDAIPLKVTKDEIAEAVKELQISLKPGNRELEPLKRLHSWLIEPLRGYLRGQTVGIVPSGALHLLPFAALTDGTISFGEARPLFYLPSASVLPFVQAKRKASRQGLLALARGDAPGFAKLDHAESEAQQVAAEFGGEAKVGKDATETELKTRAGEYGVVHVSVHGELDSGNPLYSRLVLAPSGDDDGFLEVHEVYGLKLEKTDLVTLSACQTQRGALSLGDDLVGLSRAFLYAGAPSLLASLWSVNDAATGLLMREFYRFLKQGRTKAEALQLAQAKTRETYPEPYYWSAFVLTGDPGTDAPSTDVPAGSH